MWRVVVTLFLVLSAAAFVRAQQPTQDHTQDQEDNPPEDQKVITNPAEYTAYMAALNTPDPAARAAAFDAFLQQFPTSVVRPEALQGAMQARIQLDNERNARLRQQVRHSPLLPNAPAGVDFAPQDRACKIVHEGDPEALSVQEWEFVLQYRDSGSPCNREVAEQVWRTIQNKQKSAQGAPVKITLPGVRVLSATTRSIDAAFTEENQKARKTDLRIMMETRMPKPPLAGATIDIVGVISDYSTKPFMFIVTQGAIPVEKPRR